MRNIYLLCILTFSFCNALLGETPVTNLPPIVISSTITPDTCGQGFGSIDLTVSNGQAPYTYSWSNGETTEDISNLLAGDYTVTVTDANGETAAHIVTVNDITIAFSVGLLTIHNTGCPGNYNGSLTAIVPPPHLGYTYLWSNGSTEGLIEFLAPGNYCVTVTLGISCSAVSCGHVKNAPIRPDIKATSIKTTCDLPNGSIDLVAHAFAPPLTFLWSNGETTEDLFDLSAGAYTVTVTGNNSCSSVLTVNVANTNPPINHSGVVVANSSCGNHNGSINLNPSPVGDYTFDWSTGDTSEDLANLSPGTYTVTVNGVGSCSATGTFEVLDTPSPIEIILEANDATCGQSNGSLSLWVIAIMPPPFTFDWEDIPGTNDLQNRSNLAPGTYSVTVTGTNGCTEQGNAIILDDIPFSLSAILSINTSCSTPDGSIDLSVTPSNNYTYTWSNGATTQDLTGLQSGTYTVLVRKDNCMTTAVFNVATTTPSPNLSISASTADCGQNNGTVSLNVSGSIPPYNFLWSNTATTEDLANVPPGIYSVTVTDSLGCKAFARDTIFPNNGNLLSIVATSTASPDGAVDITVSPAGTYTYLWSNAATMEDLVNIGPGTYTVTVTDNAGCTASTTVIIAATFAPLILTITTVPDTCGQGFGSANLSVSGGIAPYTYSWSNGETTEDISNLLPGDYTVTVTDANGETATRPIIVLNISPLIKVQAFGQPNHGCNGDWDGSAYVVPNPPNPAYTYLWSTGETTVAIDLLTSGFYTVTVTLGTCSNFGTALVKNFPTFPQPSATTVKTNCDLPNGSIDLSVNGPAPPFTYLWSNGETTEDLVDLLAGTYTVTVTDDNGCTAVLTENVPNTNPPINLNGVVAANTSCVSHNGSINLTATPPGTYTYDWSTGDTSEDLANLSPGEYTVTVSSVGTCSATATFEVLDDAVPIEIILGTTDAICGQSNGSLLLTVITILPPPYTFDWEDIPGSSDPQNRNNLAPGNYSVTVTGTNGCTDEASAVITNDVPFNISAITTINTSCTAPNGSIDLNVPPTGNYTYAWSTGASTQDVANLQAGNYLVTVTDANGCSATHSTTVASNTPPINVAATSTPNISCVAPNGGIGVSVLPAGNYTFLWSNAATTEDLANVPPGIYFVTVTDSLGCKAVALDTVLDNTVAFNLAAASTANTACANFNGSLDISVLPVGAYLFNWSNGATTEDLVNMPSGTYTVLATDANGCSSTISATVPDNTPAINIGAVSTPNNHCVAANGGLDISLSPAGNYTFNWSNAATTEDLSNLFPGNYSVTASHANGCTATIFASVLDSTAAPQLGATALAAICGQSNGSIDIAVTGGALPYNFAWSNAATTEDIANIFPDNYSLTVTDANGCSADTTLNVGNNASTFSLSGNPSPYNNCATLNGSVDLTVTPLGAYTYLWSGGETTEDLANLPAGTYTVQVTESGTCIASATYFVANGLSYPSLNQNIVAELCNLSDGSVDLSVLGGQAPFSYLWASGQTTEDLSNIGGGNYAVTVTDANNCSGTAAANVPENTLIFSLAGTTAPNTACSLFNGSIDLDITPALPSGGPGYSYAWSSGSGTQDLSGVPAGNYTVTVSAGGTCSSTASFTVGSAAALTAGGTDLDIPCFGESTGAIDLSMNGGTQPFGFAWSPNLGNVEDPVALVAGNYAVTVTDAGGCTATAIFNIAQPAAAVQAACSVVSTVSQPGLLDGNADVQIGGGVAPYTVLWNPGGAQNGVAPGIFSLNNLGVGNYAVTVTDANGCTEVCGFSIGLAACLTSVGTMGAAQVSHCGTGCVTADYDALGQALGPDDVLEFVLHEGPGNLIVNELSRNSQPTFCFDPAVMAYGTTYYISATAGKNDGSGSVNLAHFCTVISTGTPVVFYERPVAAAASPEPISCAKLQVDILGSSSLPNSTFQWSSLNGNILGDAGQANIKADEAGDYALIVNSNGCLDTVGTTVTDIRNDPTAEISASPDDVLDCKIDEIVLAGEVKGSNNANTVWLDGNGTVYPGGTVLTIDAPGTYLFVILDTLTFCADTANMVINQNHLYPPLFVNPPAALTCAVGSVTLSGGSPLSGILFEWATVNAQDTVVIGSGPSVSVSQPNDYLLIGSDPANGCNNALSVTVLADQSFPTASAGAGSSIDCFGQTLMLSGTVTGGSGNLAYAWSSPDGQIVSGSNTLSPVVNEPGTYTLLVTSTGNGCSDTDAVVVSPKEPRAVATVGQPGCFGQTGTILIDTVLGAKPPVEYTLAGGPHVQSGKLFSGLEAGGYTVLVEDASGCSTSVFATVDQPPVFEVIVDEQVTVQLGDSYVVGATVNVPQSEIAQVVWTPPTWLSCDTCLSTVIEAPVSAQQYQILVVTKAGCRDDATLLLRVDNSVKVYIPNVFSPDGDGENDGFTVHTGLRGVRQVKLFQIYSRWGEQVFTRENFQPNDPTLGWDGRYRGQDMNPGVFVYYAVVEFLDGQEVLFKGDVTVER